ncbi:CD99 antigen [Peromyscus leucopus]|uniref:CD99 antigen n=1 Tax=Peromyscus leucopus TaxID=10041 RepID=UPI0010A0FA5F|nr:CD99 antigen [Peromyscus leucopus]
MQIPVPSHPGDFSNSDLEDAAGGRGPGRGGEGPRSGEPDPEGSAPQGLVPGLVAAALAALAGGVSSFVAYQKRRLCFRDAGPAPV